MKLALALLMALVMATAARAEPARCVEARTDLARYYGCLNEDLRRMVPPDAARAPRALPYSAASPPNVVGGFTIAGTRQMLGNNFGISSTPQRVPRNFAPSPLFNGR